MNKNRKVNEARKTISGILRDVIMQDRARDEITDEIIDALMELQVFYQENRRTQRTEWIRTTAAEAWGLELK